MATSRPLLLCPRLLRAARVSVSSSAPPTRRWVATTRYKSSFAPRHGKAVEPTWDKSQKDGQTPGPPNVQPTEEDLAAAQQAQSDGEAAKPVKTKAPLPEKTDSPEVDQSAATGAKPSLANNLKAAAAASPPSPAKGTIAAAVKPPPRTENVKKPEVQSKAAAREADRPLPLPSLDAVLHMPSPENVRHPHLSTPPYAHHFDSWSMVKELEQGGYTKDQAVSSMKAIRTLLAGNLDVAQKSLVSKSDVENETYLFQAACSEMSTEIKNNRRLQEEQMRQQRTHLQHEIDILTQTLNQEVLKLNDSVRGLFNDRNMTVREEQKAVESAIQQINYKMSILLSSDSKSEIEGVRWILIRRSVVGLVFLAIITMSMIRYATYLAQQKKKEAERRRKERERLKRDGGRTDNSAPADAAVILSAS
ncbi:hypothetical protein AAL_06580 [Moelleriella libera RCEF 2490]|uniref:MOZ protein represents a chromatin-associated acetyltransferase n=1 Tax=Moelleriella libera RCEF 2490 TaxID=1081109 RepID=A0A167YVY5_9HYPO|nr:hypothetical protein AAL_06580 [Moelleriella libera RCEF 2490]